jgi:hypothetical protein
MNNSDVAHLFADALDVLDSWPGSFEALLERNWARRAKTDDSMGSFGHIYRRVLREPAQSWGAFARDAFVKFLTDHAEIPVSPGKVLGSRVLEARGFLTLDQARRRLNLKLDQFRALRLSPLWRAAKPIEIGSAVYLRLEAADQLKQKLASAVTMAELGEMLGIRVRHSVRRIAAHGCFLAASPGLCLDGRASYFDRADVEAFVDGLAHLKEAHKHERSIPFLEAVRMAGTRGMTAGHVVSLMRKGEIGPVWRRGKGGIHAIRFDKFSVARALDRETASRLGSVSMREAADEIGVSLMTAYQLVKSALLAPANHPGETSKLGLRVARSELDRFQTDFVSAKALASGLALQLDDLRKLLAKGTKRVFEFRDNEFYRRSDVARLLKKSGLATHALQRAA